MAKSYRNQMTPGMKMCIDHMKGKKVSEEKPEIKSVPPQPYKLRK